MILTTRMRVIDATMLSQLQTWVNLSKTGRYSSLESRRFLSTWFTTIVMVELRWS